MSSFALVVYYMVKETFNPRLHHAGFRELIEDVDMDCFRHTHSFNHMRYIKFLHTLTEE